MPILSSCSRYRGRAWILVGLVCACTSPYQLPPQTVAFRGKLNAAEARGLIAAALRRVDNLGGPYTKGIDVIVEARVVDDSIEYILRGREAAKGEPAPEGCKLWPEGPVLDDERFLFDPPPGVATRCSERVVLRGISHIDLTEESGGGIAEPGYLVLVKQNTDRFLLVSVNPAELQGFLAALTFFSPNAELTQ